MSAASPRFTTSSCPEPPTMNSASATIAPLTALTGPACDRSVSLTRLAYPPGSNTRLVRADRVFTLTH
jgi:hypothetical protein